MIRVGAAALAIALSVTTAIAQPADVPALVKLVETQPAGMDKATWKDKRRDAARKLVLGKDKRALPVLIRLAETETFDIIGEIAIEGLGTLNDPSAVPVLQQIANDPARDKAQRALAKTALDKLGASTDAGPAAPASPAPVTPGPETPVRSRGPLGSATVELALPDVADDAIAASERVTFALGTAQLEYDTVRKRSGLDFDVAGQYTKRVERDQLAWGWDAGAHLVAGLVNPSGRERVRGAQLDATANAEARLYKGGIYGIGKAALGLQVGYFSRKDQDPNNDAADTRTTADLQLALGGGYGRVLDVGGAIRVRRLSRTIEAARALGKPIDPATARKLELTWWALRRERSSYRALVETVAILRSAGILLAEPDVGLAYEIVNVLRDSQLSLRLSGLDLQLVFGEGYLIRPDEAMGMIPPAGEQGRVEQVLGSAGYGTQLKDDTVELSGAAYGRLRLFAPADQPSPWALGASARMRRFGYGDHGDPYGALDVVGDVQISDDDPIDPNANGALGLRVSGQLGFTWWWNQASGVRLAANAAIDGGELFVGAQLSASYGWLDATFSRL